MILNRRSDYEYRSKSDKFLIYVIYIIQKILFIQDILKLDIQRFLELLISNLKPKIIKFKIINSNTQNVNSNLYTKTYICWFVTNHFKTDFK